MFMVRTVMKKYLSGPGLPGSGTFDYRRLREVLDKAYSGHKPEKGCRFQTVDCGGVEAELCVPENLTGDHMVYYIHGGGLICGNCLTSRSYASQLAKAAGCRVLTCSYGLAPEHPFPEGLNDCQTVYTRIIEKYPGSKVCFIGDSGGAYLSLVLAMKCRDEGIKPPACLVLNSVVADFTGKLERGEHPKEMVVTKAAWPVLVECYCPNQDAAQPYISPLYGNFAGLPPMRIVYDRDEMLALDSQLVYQKATEAGVDAHIVEWKGTFHAFPTTGKDTPESAKELKDTARWIRNYF
jgi:acetyl esterase/lipase